MCVVYGAVTGENEVSMRFHEKLGFRLFATFRNTGYKNGRYGRAVDERQIADFSENPRRLRHWRAGQSRRQRALAESALCDFPAKGCSFTRLPGMIGRRKTKK